MLNAALKYDKLMKPVTRAMDALKREKELKRKLSEVFKQVDNLESAADEVEKFKSVVDEKSFDEKVKLLDNLSKACEKASGALKDLSKKKGDKQGEIGEIPAVEGLAGALEDFQKEVDKNLKDVKKAFNAEARDDEFKFEVPEDLTDMIELVDGNSGIGLPSDQSFDATITLSWDKIPNLGATLKKSEREFVGEIGKALQPLKQEVAKAFKMWNSEYEKIEAAFNKAEGEKLFKTINKWFTDRLPNVAKPALEDATKQALTKICSRTDGLKGADSKVKIDVADKYSNIAEFVLEFPDNPAKDLAKAAGKESSEKDFNKAVKAIVLDYKSLSEAVEKLQKEAKKSGDAKSKFDPAKQLDEISKATSELESDLKDGTKSSEGLADYLAPINKKFNDSKDSLKSKPDFDKLSKELSEALKRLKKGDGPIPARLKKLGETVADAKDIQTAIKELGGGGKSSPSADAQKKAFDLIDKKAKSSLSESPADVQKALTVSLDVDKLKSFVEKLNKT